MAARARRLTRRGLLTAAGLSAVSSGVLAGCDTSAPPRAASPHTGELRRVRYAEAHGSQFADLRLPARSPRGTVVLLHGGYWLPQYGLELMTPLARRLTELGFATWNVEYRRTGAGGGFPGTLTDVAAAVDRLQGPGLPTGLTEKVVLLGHSAGGHLAAWSASRTRGTPGGPPQLPLRGAISLSGVLNLTRAATDPRSSGPVTALMGGAPSARRRRYAVADPALLVPASCPVWAVHAESDTVVSADQSTSYVALARAAGGRAEAVAVPGDHFTLIDPTSSSFSTISTLLTRASS